MNTNQSVHDNPQQPTFNLFYWSRYDYEGTAQGKNMKTMKEWDAKIDKVISDTSWTGLQPKGIEVSISNHMMLRFLYQKGDWTLARTAWYSSLFPPGALVKRQDNYIAFVYNVYPKAFIAWPAISKDGGHTYVEDMGVQQLDWHVCTNLDDWRVIETAVQCPLNQSLDFEV